VMTFVVAAVDDRQIKTGGRTIETRRRLGGCGLCVTGRRFLRRSNGSFRRSRTLRQHRWHRHHQPSLPRAATSKPRARDAAYEFPSDEFSSAAFAAVGPLDVAGHPTLKLPTPG
jgi:hypothetical protein